jgi:uncharacterized protein (DUF1800 family)
MARDSQAALIALNRFGFGARGGASGDFVNAASDPRGFVKSELDRPNGLLLEMPGLQSTPALGAAVFAYQAEVKQAREAAAKTALPPSEAAPGQSPASDARAQMRSPSLATAASEIAGKTSADAATMNSADTKPEAGAAPMTNAPAQPEAAKPQQPLNVIQKTFRA